MKWIAVRSALLLGLLALASAGCGEAQQVADGGLPDGGASAPVRSCAIAFSFSPGQSVKSIGIGGEWNQFDPTKTPMTGPDSTGAWHAERHASARRLRLQVRAHRRGGHPKLDPRSAKSLLEVRRHHREFAARGRRLSGSLAHLSQARQERERRAARRGAVHRRGEPGRARSRGAQGAARRRSGGRRHRRRHRQDRRRCERARQGQAPAHLRGGRSRRPPGDAARRAVLDRGPAVRFSRRDALLRLHR